MPLTSAYWPSPFFVGGPIGGGHDALLRCSLLQVVDLDSAFRLDSSGLADKCRDDVSAIAG